MSNVKSANRASVLYLLNKNGSMSRKDIAQALELTPAAVTKICIDLLEENAIVECGVLDEESRAGRKKILLSLNTDNIFALSVSIEINRCYIALCTLSGKQLCAQQFSVDTQKDAVECLEEISDRCNKLIISSETDAQKIIGAGVSIVGAVDRETGETIGNYGIWKPGIKVRDIFHNKINLPVFVENNVKAFAQAELIFDNKNTSDNVLFVKWGPGVGSAIVISNEVYVGHGNTTAEIGHYIVNPNGKLCRCGRKGCLETHVSSQAIIDRIRECYSEKETPALFKMTDGDINKVSFKFIMENKNVLDKCIVDIFDRRINRMARAVVNASTIIEPDKVVIFGYMFDKDTTQKFIDYCKAYYYRYDDDFIVLSCLQDKIDFIGPLAIVAKNLFFEK